MYKFGFIGTGKMGGAILKVISESAGAENVIIFDKNTAQAQKISEKTGCAFSENIGDIVEKSEYIVLGVKPQNAEELLGGISSLLK